MSEERWGAYDSIATALSTDLNSLANGSLAISSAIDFTASGVDRKKYMDVEIYLASVNLSGVTNPAIYVWLLARSDGTNYEDGDGSTTPARPPDKVVPLRVVNGAQRVFTRFILTVPDYGKILVKNAAGAALAASGNTVKYYTYGDEII